MNIMINDTRSVVAIQEEFSRAFPFLRIEFFPKKQEIGTAIPKKNFYTSTRTLAECRTNHNAGILSITPSMTVADLEQIFLKDYGLSVQILRKSGKVWLGTTVTDGWTLDEQNNQGAALSQITS